MPKVLFSGTFCSLNKGDAAMQISAYRSLRAVVPEAEITIHTPFPEIDRQTYSNYRLFGSCRRRAIQAMFLLLRAMLWSSFRKFGAAGPKWLLAHPELQEYQRADVIVDLSGDTITQDYGLRCLISHLIPVFIAAFLERPVVLCAQTIGPFGITKPLAKFALNRVTLITAREELSLNELRGLGVEKPRVHLTADIAFLLEPAPAQRIDEIIAAEGIGGTGRLLVGFTPSRLLGHRFGAGDDGKLERVMAALADYLIEQKGATVVLLSHVLGPGQERDDRGMARGISSLVKHRTGVRVVMGDYRPEELKGLIGRFHLFLSLRMHASIAALSLCVPTIAIAYSRKTHGIMKMLGQDHWVCDLAALTPDNLLVRLEALWAEREAVRAQLATRVEAVKTQARENAKLVRDVIEAGTA